LGSNDSKPSVLYSGTDNEVYNPLEKKNGVQDVNKAIHYFQKLKESLYAERLIPANIPYDEFFGPVTRSSHVREVVFLDEFAQQNDLGKLEYDIIKLALGYTSISEIMILGEKLEELLEEAKQLDKQ
jgi:hypothetical protein